MTDHNHTLTDQDTPDADTLHRGVKIALDTGEATSVTAAYQLFKTYRLAVVVGTEIIVSVRRTGEATA